MWRRAAVLAWVAGSGCGMTSTPTSEPPVPDAVATETDSGSSSCPPARRVIWARAAGGPNGSAGANAVVVADDGSIIVVGSFSGSITFDRSGPHETTLIGPAGNGNAGFVARYAAAGELRWAERVTSGPSGALPSAAVLASDAALVAGMVGGAASFGPNGEAPVTTAWGTALYLASFDLDGGLRWVRASRGMTTIDGLVLAASPDGGSLVAGLFSGGTAAVFDLGDDGQTTLSGDGSFLARSSADGSFSWARAVARPRVAGTPIALTGVAAGNADGAYLTGWFCGNDLVIGPGDPAQTWASSQPCLPEGPFAPTAFVARFDGGGALEWAHALPSSAPGSFTLVSAAGTTTDGALVVTGNHHGDVILGVGEPRETTLRGDGAFLARYAPSGALQRATAIDLAPASAVTSRAGETLASVRGLVHGCAADASARTDGVALFDRDDALRWGVGLEGAAVTAVGLAEDAARGAIVGSFTDEVDLDGLMLPADGSYANVFVAALAP